MVSRSWRYRLLIVLLSLLWLIVYSESGCLMSVVTLVVSIHRTCLLQNTIPLLSICTIVVNIEDLRSELLHLPSLEISDFNIV